jgi:Tol biopolymer transport system component
MKLFTALVTSMVLALVGCGSQSSAQTSVVPPPRGTIVFGRVINANGDENLFTIGADGSSEKQLVAALSCCVVWSHKGDRLSLAAFGASAGSVTTAIVNADGSGYRVLPIDSSGLNLGGSAWSPDDNRLAFEGWDDSKPSLNGIYTADTTDGGNRRRLTTTTAAEHDIPVSYSPDGSRILFWRGATNSDYGQLLLVGVDGGEVTQVSPPGMTVSVGHGGPGGWSSSGTRISFAAFSPTASDPGRSAVFVAAGDGTNPKQISDWGEYTTSARWSPTADWIVFDRINAIAGSHTFYLIHADGTGIKSIPSLAAVCCAVWSPDGDRLLFARGPSEPESDLWTVMVDGSHLTQLTHTPAELTDVGWSKATR